MVINLRQQPPQSTNTPLDNIKYKNRSADTRHAFGQQVDYWRSHTPGRNDTRPYTDSQGWLQELKLRVAGDG